MSRRPGQTGRGTSNGNAAGSAAQRRARRQWLLEEFGDGVTAPCSIALSGVCTGPVDIDTLTVDRWPVPGCDGGRFRVANIRPACGRCNATEGGARRRAAS